MPDDLPSNRSVAVVVMVLARFLATTQMTFPKFVANSLAAAQAANLSDADLAFLKTVAKSIGSTT